MKRMTLILCAMLMALFLTAAVCADDLFSGTENTIAVTISADDAVKLADPENADSFTGLLNLNGNAASGSIRRATRDEMMQPGPQGGPQGEPPADGERPEGMPEPPQGGPQGGPQGEPPADGERPEGMPEPPQGGPQGGPQGEPPADGERPEDMPEMISYVLTIDGTDYLLMSMPEMPEDLQKAPGAPEAPEKPADAPEMPEQISGTLSINGEDKGNINIIPLAK